jgi:RloB-like protein
MNVRSLARKSASVSPKTKFTIYSEGMNTEPEYFTALGSTVSAALVELKIHKAAGVPTTIASKALQLAKSRRRSGNADSFEKFDQIWVVFDQDTHDKVKESIDNLGKSSVKVAYSNPCFELWLILHLQDFDKPVDHHQVQKHLEGICSDYSASSGKNPDCMPFVALVEKAESRATKMNQRRIEEGASGSAPWTTVHELTKAIRTAGKR